MCLSPGLRQLGVSEGGGGPQEKQLGVNHATNFNLPLPVFELVVQGVW